MATVGDCSIWFNTREFQKAPYCCVGVFSTALDMAILGQTLLNRGTYGDVRILSPVSVAAMTRNQIPGISAQYREQIFPEASWGFGWSINESKK